MDHTWLLLLRLVHVIGGMLWVGAVVALAWFVVPTARLEGAHGGRFVDRMMEERHFATYIPVLAIASLISGFVMYGRAMAATQGQWASTRPAMVYGLGAVTAVLAMIVGITMGAASEKRMAAINRRLRTEGREPTAAETALIDSLRARAGLGSRIASVLLLVTAVAMAVARYA